MGNACHSSSKKSVHNKVDSYPRDFQPAVIMKKEDLDRAIAREETTTSYENITKVYNFKKELGHGHFGTVRLASLLSNPSQKFAIKAIEKQKMKKDLYLLKRELQILRKIDHPNVIKFYETYQDERFFYLVQEYCSGGELLDRIAKDGFLPEHEVLALMQKIFSAVKYLHTLGIVHRDLKPENFLLSSPGPEGEIKVIDFGLSKFLGDVPGGRLRTTVGTGLYMAPEVLGSNYDERCDNWSLGVLMYVLLSGTPPFEGDNANAVFQKILKGKFSYKGPEWKKISSQAKDLINKLLVVNPDQRMTASKALEHEWFQQRLTTRPSIPKPSEKALKILKEYQSDSELDFFRMEVKQVIVNAFSEAEMKEYRTLFGFLDPENSGTISIKELEKAFGTAGFNDAENKAQNVLKKIHPNGGQSLISYRSFLTVILSEKILYTEEKVTEAFNIFDVDHSGEITVQNIKEKLARNGRRVNDSEIKSMLGGITLKKKMRISFEEFKVLLGLEQEK